MKFDLFDRRSAERFAELLDESHRRHHRSGAADDQLAELAAIGRSLSAARVTTRVDPEFRVGLRAMLVATAERDGIGGPVNDPEPAGEPAARERVGLLGRGSARRIRARGAIVIGVAAGAMAVSGISAASENAEPGDALYGVKRQTEKAQLAMAGSDLTRGQLSLDFARTRLAEATAMAGADRDLPQVLTDMDAGTVQGVRLLTGSAVARTDAAPLTAVDTFVTRQRRTFEPVLERLSPGNRERAQASITLLDAVDRRTDSLRAGLACRTVTPDGVDQLGPRLRACATGSGPAGPDATGRAPGHPGRSEGRPSGGTAPTADTGTPRTGTSTTGARAGRPDSAPVADAVADTVVADPAAADPAVEESAASTAEPTVEPATRKGPANTPGRPPAHANGRGMAGGND